MATDDKRLDYLLTPEVFELADGYSRLKNPPLERYRFMRPDEARSLTYGEEIPFLALDGKARNVRVSGKVRTWKRDATRVEVPCKYGLRESATFYGDILGRMRATGGVFLLVRCE